jgi:hypothetical protein
VDLHHLLLAGRPAHSTEVAGFVQAAFRAR